MHLYLTNATERITYHASLCNILPTDRKANIPSKIIALSETPKFREILEEEVSKYGLDLQKTLGCIPGLYQDVRSKSSENEIRITLFVDDYSPEQFVVLISFLRLQSTWLGGFFWVTKLTKMRDREAIDDDDDEEEDEEDDDEEVTEPESAESPVKRAWAWCKNLVGWKG